MLVADLVRRAGKMDEDPTASIQAVSAFEIGRISRPVERLIAQSIR